MANRTGKWWKQGETLFSRVPKSLWIVTAVIKLKTLPSWNKIEYKDSVLKRRGIIFPTKVHKVNAMVFPVVMYGCECWNIKKTESRRTDAFKLWSWIRLSRVPWAASRSNQPILMEINHEYSLEGLMFKLKLQHFGHLMQRPDSLEKTLMLGKIEAKRRKGRQRMKWLDDITNSMDMGFGGLQELVMDRVAWHAVVHG